MSVFACVLCDSSSRPQDLERGLEYATKVDEPAVWSELGHAQLGAGAISDAIASYLRCSDSSKWTEVIAAAQLADCYEVRALRAGWLINDWLEGSTAPTLVSTKCRGTSMSSDTCHCWMLIHVLNLVERL